MLRGVFFYLGNSSKLRNFGDLTATDSNRKERRVTNQDKDKRVMTSQIVSYTNLLLSQWNGEDTNVLSKLSSTHALANGGACRRSRLWLYSAMYDYLHLRIVDVFAWYLLGAICSPTLRSYSP